MAADIPVPNDGDWCAVENDSLPDPPGVYSKSIDPIYLLNNFDPVYFNIFFWGVNRSDGTSDNPLTEIDVLNAVENLNDTFNQFNICFVLKGFDYINSDDYYISPGYSSTSSTTIFWYAAQNNNQYVKENSFNVYVPYLFEEGYSGIGPFNRTRLGINSITFHSKKLHHELGHNFNLYHTYGGWQGSGCERVTRDINDLNYNANTNGDRIHDTSAIPDVYREQREYGIKALAAIGYSTSDASTILTDENGFVSHPNAVAIESALLNYGFTLSEVDYIKFNGIKYYAYIDLSDCSYTGSVRLDSNGNPYDMFTDCGGTPYNIHIDDVRNMMLATHASCRSIFTTGQAIRMREAINDDKYGEFEAAIREHPLDLYIRDHEGDIGQEPNIHTDVYWNSPDIWVRNAADGQPQHQNPNFGANPNHIYVRVTNKSCVASTGEEELKIYWAKADTGHGGSALWLGQITAGPNSTPLGGSVGTISLPIIDSGDEAVVQIPWNAPNPELFSGIIDKPWHFCLMARIVADDDPMAHTNEWSSKQNNNVASKNVTVVDVQGVAAGLKPGGAISIGNITVEEPQDYDYGFFPAQPNSTIYDEAEVLINLTEEGYLRWLAGGAVAENIEVYREGEYQLIITGPDAVLKNMAYDAGEWDILYLSFNFLTEEVTGQDYFEYQVVQKDPEGNVIGGEVFEIYRDPERLLFAAEGDSFENTSTGQTEMTATDIDEPAVYNWYAPEGELLYSGKEFSFVPDVPGDYLLEVIAEADGHKDYFKLTLNVNAAQDQILNLSPNPASAQVAVEYQVGQNAAAAAVKIVAFFGSVENTYPIDLNDPNCTLNIPLTNYSFGHYAVILTVDGQAVHAKQLIIN